MSPGSARHVDDVLSSLGDRWRRARRVAVLTGAGLSTASGIPDFRSPGGRWSRHQPVTIQEFLSDEEARRRYWSYKGETWRVIAGAQPNPGHEALAELMRAGSIDLLVTQNVDGLHERSGVLPERLVNVHGTDSAVRCVDCAATALREVAQRAWEAGALVPRCECGGAWKPATISFGQSLVEHDLARAFAAARDCDLFLAVGTSLVVGPINQMFVLAAQSGAATAILTASETPFDDAVTWRLREPVETVLPALRDLVLGTGAP